MGPGRKKIRKSRLYNFKFNVGLCVIYQNIRAVCWKSVIKRDNKHTNFFCTKSRLAPEVICKFSMYAYLRIFSSFLHQNTYMYPHLPIITSNHTVFYSNVKFWFKNSINFTVFHFIWSPTYLLYSTRMLRKTSWWRSSGKPSLYAR